MQITENRIKVRDVYENYENDDEEGVVGYDDRLDIRPRYQREFVYKDAKRDAVIDTVLQGLPLNVMYWAKTGDDTYEVLDGQQRTISLMEYVDGNFSIKYENNAMNFDNLPEDVQERILDYELLVYICDGTDSEKLKWFKTINIAGERLTNQELRNAVYAGRGYRTQNVIFRRQTAQRPVMGTARVVTVTSRARVSDKRSLRQQSNGSQTVTALRSMDTCRRTRMTRLLRSCGVISVR